MQYFRRGDRGPVVAEVREKLHQLGLLGEADPAPDVFCAATDRAVRAFQQQRGLRVDGIVGPETYRTLDEAHWRLGDRLLGLVPGHLYVGDDVAMLQQRLLDLGFDPGRVDGIFGTQTEQALREFQRNVGLTVDGTLGPTTLRALSMLRRTVTGGSLSSRREEERLREHGGLSGRTIVLDPGHGGDDPGHADHGLTEAEIVYDVASRVEGRLGPLGVSVMSTRGPDAGPDDVDRAGLANSVSGDLLVSFHVDRVRSPAASGVATYFYGADLPGRSVRSEVGARLADLVQREIVARTDLVDCRAHPKAWQLLRMTRMPAVRVDLGYLSNDHDAARLGSAEFRDTLAEAVVVAIQRLYLPVDDLTVTGQIRIPALSR